MNCHDSISYLCHQSSAFCCQKWRKQWEKSRYDENKETTIWERRRGNVFRELNSINLWMNNFISFRRNHVLLPASYTHVRLYTDAFPHLHTFWRICATNDVQKSRVQAAWIYRRTIDIMPDAVRASSARSLFPLHFFINPFSPKSLFGKNIDWVCQGSYEYWYEWILISIKT